MDYIAPSLKKYLQTRGTVLPVDTEAHEKGIFKDRCLFCTRPHDNIVVHKFGFTSELDSYSEATFAHACKECAKIIDTMVSIDHPDLREKRVQEILKERNTMETEDPGRREYRIKRFNTKKGLERFDNTLASSYIHVRPNANQEGVGFCCYFCKELFSVEGASIPITIKVPVYDSKIITGGELPVCEACLAEVWDAEPNDTLESKCSFCSKKYYVSPEEHNIRVSQNTVGKHMCPMCVQGGLDNQVFSDSRSVVFANIEAIKRGERFDFPTCYQCDTQFVIDFTLDHTRLIRTRQINGKPICGTCFTFKLGKVNGNKFVFQYKDSGYFVVINQVDGYWVYRISTIKDGQEHVELKPSSMACRSKNILEIIDVGYDQVAKLIDPQLKLDLHGHE